MVGALVVSLTEIPCKEKKNKKRRSKQALFTFVFPQDKTGGNLKKKNVNVAFTRTIQRVQLCCFKIRG